MALQAKMLENVPWVRVSDWSKLTSSHKSSSKGKVTTVCEKDIDDFVAKMIRKISERLKIPYDEVKDVITRNNGKFYQEKKELFTSRNSCSLQEAKLRYLENSLIMPDIDNRSSKCYLTFASLSMRDKKMFLEKVQKVAFCKEVVKYLQNQRKS